MKEDMLKRLESKNYLEKLKKMVTAGNRINYFYFFYDLMITFDIIYKEKNNDIISIYQIMEE